MLRVMLDTNIYDALAEDSATLNELKTSVSDRKVQVVITHIQMDELRCIPDEEKRLRLLSLLDVLEAQQVPTEGAIWDVSKWDEAKWGTDEVHDDLTAFVGQSKNQSDALIGITGDRVADWLVTRNMRDFRAMERFDSKARLMSYEAFKEDLATLRD